MTAPEFSHVLRQDRAPDRPQPLHLAANAEERSALARRFGLLTLDRLEADLTWWRDGADLRLSGTFSADLAQACVVTGEAVPAHISEPLTIRFSSAAPDDGDEIELDAEDCDSLPYDGLSADAGEAVAQGLALALNPYPRAEGADAVLKSAGVISEEDAGAFGALAALRDQLARK